MTPPWMAHTWIGLLWRIRLRFLYHAGIEIHHRTIDGGFIDIEPGIILAALSLTSLFVVHCSQEHSISRQSDCDSVGYVGMLHNWGLIGVDF